MELFKSYKDNIIEDQLKTIKRLNEELGMRIKYEEQLIHIINKFERYEENDRRKRELLAMLGNDYSEDYITETEKEMYAERQRGFDEFMRLDESERKR